MGSQPIAVNSRSAQSLLAYLVMTAGTAHRREYLAGLLWPDQPDNSARNNLRNALWRLRRVLTSTSAESPYIVSDEISIAFNERSDYWVDTSVLECAASQRATTTDLINLLLLYRGELLPGFYDEWIILERARLQALFDQEMQRLLNHLIEEQRWTEILDWGERWIAFGQIPEPAYRALMIAYSALGDASKVAAVFQRCVQSLHDELGVEPSEQTRAMFEQLSQIGAYAHEQNAPVSRQAVTYQPTPFVGREYELAQLDKFLAEALAGRGRVIFITGEAGSGKTALAQAFTGRSQAAQANLLVTIGMCSAYAGVGDPYLPFREALNLLTGDIGAKWVGGSITPENASRLQSFTPVAARTLVDAGPDLIDSFVSGTSLLTRLTNAAPRRAEWVERLKALMAHKIGIAGSVPLEQNRIYEQYSKVLLALAAQ